MYRGELEAALKDPLIHKYRYTGLAIPLSTDNEANLLCFTLQEQGYTAETWTSKDGVPMVIVTGRQQAEGC